MLMMHIGHVRMAVPQGLMDMPVAVRPDGHGRVGVVVMPIVMVVGMLMIQGFMVVLVTMALCQVEGHTAQHQAPSDCHQEAS